MPRTKRLAGGRLVRRAAAASAIVGTCCVFAACGDSSDDSSSTSASTGVSSGAPDFDLKIGAILPFTGDGATYGPPFEKAIKTALVQIDKSIKDNGLDGKVKVDVVGYEDDQGDAKAAVEAATKLVQTQQANAIIDGFASSTAIPVAQSVTIPNNVLQVSMSASADAITDLNDDGYVNRIYLPNAFGAIPMVKLVSDKLGSDATINIGLRNDAYGVGQTEQFVKLWEAQGGKVGKRVAWDPKAANFDSEAQKFVSGNPDGYVIIDFSETFSRVGPALVRTGKWDPKKTIGNDALDNEETFQKLGSNFAGVEGVAGVSEGSPAGDAFAKALKQQGGGATTDLAPTAFDATMLIYLAAIAARSSDPSKMKDKLQAVSAPPGTKITFENLDEGVKLLLEGKDIDYQGAWSPIDLNDKGDPTSGQFSTWQFNGDKTVYGKPFTISSQGQ